MSYTLKFEERNTPFFLKKDNKTFSHSATQNFVEHETVNELARALINNKYNIDSIMKSGMVVSKSDVISLNNDEKLASITDVQDYTDSLKLVCVDRKDTFGVVSERRAARIYLTDVKMDKLDPQVEQLQIIKVDNFMASTIKIGDDLVLCSNYSGKIFYEQATMKVLEKANADELFENKNVDIENFTYYAVLTSK